MNDKIKVLLNFSLCYLLCYSQRLIFDILIKYVNLKLTINDILVNLSITIFFLLLFIMVSYSVGQLLFYNSCYRYTMNIIMNKIYRLDNINSYIHKIKNNIKHDYEKNNRIFYDFKYMDVILILNDMNEIYCVNSLLLKCDVNSLVINELLYEEKTDISIIKTILKKYEIIPVFDKLPIKIKKLLIKHKPYIDYVNRWGIYNKYTVYNIDNIAIYGL